MFVEEPSAECIVRSDSEYDHSNNCKNLLVNHQESIEIQNTYYEDNPDAFTYFRTEADFSEDVGSKLFTLGMYPTSFRKPCNCAKSHCLKLYCECFARGSACENCNCSNCMNNALHESDRRRAIKLTLERNPMAFHPKIGEGERKHSKGCNCKRSGCLKNYCECYEAKISCSDLCRCQGCRNFGDGKVQRLSSDIQSTSNLRNKSSNKKSNACFECDPTHAGYREDYIRLPHANQAFGRMLGIPYQEMSYGCYPEEPQIPMGFLTTEIAEVACSCMIAQLAEAKQRDLSPVSQERVVLEEFGKCLEQIMESAVKLQQVSAASDPSVYQQTHNPDFITVLPTDQGTIIADQGFQSVQDNMQHHNAQQNNLNLYSYVQYPISNNTTELMNYTDQIPHTYNEQAHYNAMVVSLSNEESATSLANQTENEFHYTNNFDLIQKETKFDPSFVEPVAAPNNHYFALDDAKTVQQTLRSEPQFKATQDYYFANQVSGFQSPTRVETLANDTTEPGQTSKQICSPIYNLTNSDGTQDVDDNCTYNKINTLLKNSDISNDKIYVNDQEIIGNDAEEEDEESHTATAALLNMSFQCENNRFGTSAEVDLISINEINGPISECESTLNGHNQMRSFITVGDDDTNSLLPHSGTISIGNPFNGNDQHDQNINLKSSLGFYDL